MSDSTPKIDPIEPVGIQFDISDPSIPDYYVNVGIPSVTANDVSICFARQLCDWNGFPTKPKGIVRLTMTHNMFMLMMKDIIPQYQLLTDLYGEEIPNLLDLERRHPERFEEVNRRLSGDSKE